MKEPEELFLLSLELCSLCGRYLVSPFLVLIIPASSHLGLRPIRIFSFLNLPSLFICVLGKFRYFTELCVEHWFLFLAPLTPLILVVISNNNIEFCKSFLSPGATFLFAIEGYEKKLMFIEHWVKLHFFTYKNRANNKNLFHITVRNIYN